MAKLLVLTNKINLNEAIYPDSCITTLFFAVTLIRKFDGFSQFGKQNKKQEQHITSLKEEISKHFL